MTTTDVSPNVGTGGGRLTNHLFDLSDQPTCGFSGQAIRVPLGVDRESQWPPSSLFDAIYASTIIHQFGVNPEDIFDVFYEPDWASRAGQTDDQRRHDQDDATKKDLEKQTAQRNQRHENREQGYRGRRDGCFDSFDVLAALPFTAMPVEKARVYFEGCREMAAAQEHEALDVKVNSWRDEL